MKLLLSPHHDDETLFAAFTIIRERPHVVVCYGSERDYGSTATRAQESAAATEILGASSFEWWECPVGDENFLHSRLVAFDRDASTKNDPIEHVWAPHELGSHRDHALLGRVAADVFRGRLTPYSTYGEPHSETVLVQHAPEWTLLKLRALACYRSQIRHPRANKFFMQGLHEYVGRDV